MHVIITIGVSASGKTTWANSQDFPILCRDDIRAELMEADGESFSWAGWKWKREKEVTRIYDERLDFILSENEGTVILADTNLNYHRLKARVESLKNEGHTVEFKFFPITFEEACRRDTARPNGVGYSVIAKQFEQLEELRQWAEIDLDVPVFLDSAVGASEWIQCLDRPNDCIIVDVDGTVAHMHNRGPYDWDRVKYDGYKINVCELIRAYVHSFPETKLIFVSGRDGCCYEDTRKWLECVFDGDFMVLMREAGDQRKDTIVKREIFEKWIAPFYSVRMVFDDRLSVCRMWRSLGLEVIQIGNPYVEF